MSSSRPSGARTKMSYTTNFSINKGENVTLAFSPATTQTPTDVTGWTLVFSVRHYFDDSAALLTITTTLTANGQLTVTNAAQGLFNVDLTAAATGTVLGAGAFSWDVWRTDAGFEAELAGGT